MRISIVGADEARELALGNAGLTHADVTTPEQVRLAMLRLAATRLCPVGRVELAGAAKSALRGILPSQDISIDDIDGGIDALLGSGDFLVGREAAVEGRRQVLIYLAPPMFVRRATGAVYIVGGQPEESPPFLESTIMRGSIRELVPPPSDEALLERGFTQIPMDAWMEAPLPRSAASLLQSLEELLLRQGNAGRLDELEIIDPAADSSFYRGRWAAPRRLTGHFIARRKRKWGGRAWGYADLVNGEVTRFVTFPALDTRFGACDEAWWAILAADSERGVAQQVGVEDRPTGTCLSFCTPLPGWAERRLLLSGRLTEDRPRGSLLAYEVAAADAPEILSFLTERLWMESVGKGERS
jgi:hypothetical protein